MNNYLGKNIKKLRQKENMNQKDLAKELDVSAPAISFWEQGSREPSVEIIIKIAQIFNVTTDFLFGLEPEQSKHTEALKEIEKNCAKLDEHEIQQVRYYSRTLAENKEKLERDFPLISKFRS